MKSASNQFKVVLMNLNQEELYNFIWMYDQYVTNMVDYEDDEGRPVNIEEFYPLYKKEFSLNR
jgi:hypothetical protein